MKSIPGLLLGAGSSERFGHRNLLTRLPIHDESVTWDVDTPRDLERLSELGYSGGPL